MTIPGQALSRLVAVDGTTGLDPACLLPSMINIDDLDTPCDMVDVLALAAFAAGRQPFARTMRVDEVRIPAGAQRERLSWNGAGRHHPLH